jgi:hypothetical protein
MQVSFVVEHAGCASCAERVRTALAGLGEVLAIEIDEEDDSAGVQAHLTAGVTREDVERSVVEASAGSGHKYGVRRGSCLAAG